MKRTSTVHRHKSISAFGQESKTLVVFLVIIALGAVLRLYDLGAESFWSDEIMLIHAAKKSPQWIVFRGWNPPVYPLLAHFWIGLFGTTEAAARSLSAVAGIASLAVGYAVARHLFGVTVGLVSMFLMAISEFLIYYSQDCRWYSVFVLMTLLSFFFYVRSLKTKKLRDFALYVFATLLLFYTHTYGAFILFAQILFTLLRWKKLGKARARWIASHLLILFGIGSPLLVVVLRTAAGRQPGMDWIPDPPFWAPLRVLLIYLFHRFYYYYSSPAIIARNCLPALVFLVLGVLVFVRNKGKKKWLASVRNLFGRAEGLQDKSDEIILTGLWLFCPILIPFIASMILGPIYLFRYTACAAPAFFMLLALGITYAQKVVPKVIALGTLVLLLLPSLHYYYANPVNEQWREAAAFIEENAGESDVIATAESFSNDWIRRCFRWYYHGRLKVCTIPSRAQDDTVIREAFAQCITGRKNIWLVFRETVLGFDHDFKARLYDGRYADLRIVEERKFEGVSVHLFSVED